jgi:hypothetical protein
VSACATSWTTRFDGAKIMVARSVASLNYDVTPYKITLDDGQQFSTRTKMFPKIRLWRSMAEE